MTDLLSGSASALLDDYDRLLLDLDGVCYVGDQVIPAAIDALHAVRAAGIGVRFLTNNASRTPDELAERLVGFGIDADATEMVTSASCAAQVLAADLPAGSPVLVVGGTSLVTALGSVGLRPVDRADAGPVAVVQGWHPDVGWRMLAEAAVAISRGARWVATNLDATIPSERGRLPGNGALVAALGMAVDQEPESIGKPEPVMYDAAAEGGSIRSLAVGDRLDTDIAGAVRAGLPSLLVMTGVTTARDLLLAAGEQRPTYVAPDLSGVCRPAPAARRDGWSFRCGDAVAELADAGPLRVSGGTGPDGLDRLRAAAVAAWAAVDSGRLTAEEVEALDLDV